MRAARLLVEPASDLDSKIGAQLEQIQSTPWMPRELDRLGWLFIAKARRSQDSIFYGLALQTAECMHRVGGDQASALLLEGHALYSVHRFREAAAAATRLVAVRTTPFDYGLLGNTLLSQGEIEQAAAAYQRMMDLKPSLQSYSRAAQIRWLTGDLDGARELMAMAARSGTERDPETLAWTLSELARLELIAGNVTQAHRLVVQALQLLPDHSTSLLVRGRVQLAAGQPAEAVDSLRSSVRINSSTEALWALADALRVRGDTQAADEAERQLLETGAMEDPRTTALFLSTRQLRPELAVSLARRELSVRRDPFTHDALGWALAAAGDIQRADHHLREALAHDTIDARLFLHAGVVAAAAGRTDEATSWLTRAAHHKTGLLPSEQAWLAGSIKLSKTPAGVEATRPCSLRRQHDSKTRLICHNGRTDVRVTDVPDSGAGVEPYGRATHHPGRRRQHDRCLCLSVATQRDEAPDDRARRLPVRGTRNRTEQVQL